MSQTIYTPGTDEWRRNCCPVRCITDRIGDPEIFESLAEMERAVHELDELNPGEGYWPEEGLVEGRDYEFVRMFMQTDTGSVAPLEEWERDYQRMSEEEWGGDTFESAGLIEVEPDGSGWWKEV